MCERPDLHQLAVEVDHPRRVHAAALVQVIDILGHHRHVIAVLQGGYGFVGRVGRNFKQLPAAFVVEPMDQRRIGPEPVDAAHLHHRILLPESICVAKSRYAAFGTDAGSRKKYYFPLHDPDNVFRFEIDSANIRIKTVPAISAITDCRNRITLYNLYFRRNQNCTPNFTPNMPHFDVNSYQSP